ncbi:single-stranded-DNA-specific exonuclease RecJ [Methylonatrum kenyense]|uniref:single-stranded-DNA-specific exonuclease RecJ n=1 Tax=Methylonatrum kenyense TaxID=455253 RepID=UPI003D1334D8
MRRIRRRPVAEEHRQALLADQAISPLAARILAGRGVRDAADLDLGLQRLHPATELGGLDRAVALLATAVERDQRIVVVGDFDADGATSCALTLLALRAMGHRSASYIVPNRFSGGYGLSPAIADHAHEQGAELLLTVDNGVSSIDGVARARALGLRVIVTDHHLPPPRLPDADAMVNPNLVGDGFPSKNLAGVGVIFYVLAGLRSALREAGWFGPQRPQPSMADWLDLVALGTVADVVPLDRNNRVLVEQGLRRIRAGRARPGVLALLEVAGRDPSRVTAADLGFAVGPRLNAAGRLEDMAIGIECLLSDDSRQAAGKAAELDELNRQRRSIEQDMESDALAALEKLERVQFEASPPAGFCLFDPAWHQGVIGILASRLRERFHRPVIAFALAEDGLKGSARSIPGLHIRDLLERINAGNPGLIAKFGGHAAAAGLSLAMSDLERFRQAFLEHAEESLEPEMLNQDLLTDGSLAADQLSLGTVESLHALGPWGKGFPEPSFDGRFEILQRRVVGGRHLRLDLRPSPPVGHAAPVEAIAFRALDRGWDQCGRHVQLVYRPDINRWQGRRRLQLIVEHMQPVTGME